MGKAYVSTNAIVAAGVAISQSSQNPERAAMVYNNFFKDIDLVRMMFHGIEGEHYETIDENTVELIGQESYYGLYPWEFANQFDDFLLKGQPENTWELHKELNENAVKSAILGFSYSPENVKTEVAKCSAISAEYVPMFVTGSYDIDEKLPEYIEKIENAGADIIIADIQEQLDAWRTTVGK
jgi:putative aldouronate transport system substrate-binding protein